MHAGLLSWLTGIKEWLQRNNVNVSEWPSPDFNPNTAVVCVFVSDDQCQRKSYYNMTLNIKEMCACVELNH